MSAKREVPHLNSTKLVIALYYVHVNKSGKTRPENYHSSNYVAKRKKNHHKDTRKGKRCTGTSAQDCESKILPRSGG